MELYRTLSGVAGSSMRRVAAHRLSRRRLGAAAAGSGAAALLAACGSKKGAGSSAGSNANQAAGKPRTGGTLNLPLVADFFDFDMSVGGKSPYNPFATTLALESLLTVQQGPNVPYDNTVLAPSLADRWETPDAQNFTFHLHPGLKFSDTPPVNGREVTSADVKWSFEYWSRTGEIAGKKLPPAQFLYMFEGLTGIETPDPSTLVVRFKAPFAPFLNYSATYATVIVPHEIYDQDGTFQKRLVGTGPYLLDTTATQKGASWSFKRNPNYWQSGKPYLDGIHYIVIQETATTYAAFQTKQVDILKSVQDSDVPTVAANNRSAVRQQALSPNANGCYLNAQRPPFNDVRMRQAVSLAINRDEFDKVVGSNNGGYPMPAATPDLWTPAEARQILKYDPAQAKQLVSAAGYPNGVDAELMTREGQNPTEQQLFQSQLKAVGINLAIANVDAATYSKREHGGSFIVDLHAYPIFGDIDSRLYGTYFSTGSANRQGTNDPKLDQLILAQRREPDPAKRRDALRAVTKYIAENAVDIAFYRPNNNTFWQPYVKNYADNWQQSNWNAPNIWLEK